MRHLKFFIFLALSATMLYAYTTSNNHQNISNNSKEVTLTNTPGTLHVSTLTSAAGGSYAPRNIVAIWVEDSSGVFVKTLLAYANTYRQFLTHWKIKSQYNTTDAISGATVNSHATRSCNWNGTNTSGVVVPDGKYRICFELTDKNATGNYSYFEILKDSISHSLTPSNVSSFSNISIEWTPNNSNGFENHGIAITSKLYPNPNNGQFTCYLNFIPDNTQIEFYSALGQLIKIERIDSDIQNITLNNQKGLVFYVIRNQNKVVCRGKFIIK